MFLTTCILFSCWIRSDNQRYENTMNGLIKKRNYYSITFVLNHLCVFKQPTVSYKYFSLSKKKHVLPNLSTPPNYRPLRQPNSSYYINSFYHFSKTVRNEWNLQNITVLQITSDSNSSAPAVSVVPSLEFT